VESEEGDFDDEEGAEVYAEDDVPARGL